VALVILDLYADQLGRSEEIDGLFNTLHERVLGAVDASQRAWCTIGMVEMLTSSGGVEVEG
jgi:U3 small nucleolar RNA-associated protein 15